MPVSRPPRPRAAGALLLALSLELAACGAAVPSEPVTNAPGQSASASAAASAAASLAAMSVAPSVATTAEPSMAIEPSATAPPATPTVSVSPSTAPPSATAAPAPTRQSTPAPTQTARPTLKPTPKATPKPTTKPTPKPTTAPVVLGIEARDFQFSPSSLTGPAGVPFTIVFTNADAAIPHNVTIATGSGASRFNGAIVNGVASITYQVPASPAGMYRFGCIVHPAMTGTLTLD